MHGRVSASRAGLRTDGKFDHDYATRQKDPTGTSLLSSSKSRYLMARRAVYHSVPVSVSLSSKAPFNHRLFPSRLIPICVKLPRASSPNSHENTSQHV